MNPANRTISAVSVVVAAIALSACGSNDDSGTATAAGGGQTVSTASIDGAGTVLVDSGGSALYSPSEEANGMITCTDSCERIWKPLSANGTPSASADVTGDLGTVKRPDGGKQVTLDGAPLYTFAEDSPGQVTGDGLQDSFAGKRFTWHVVTAGDSGSPGETTTSGSSPGAYGY
jgi:predicted lipoprotein with Yx(FWY)xxD motif